MPIKETDVRWVSPPRMGLMDRLYLPAILSGMGTTLKHVFQPKVTQQFRRGMLTYNEMTQTLVKSGDAILIIRKDEAQDVRKVVDALSARGLARYL